MFPERLAGPEGLVLRRWTVEDAESLGRAVADSAEHLRPWMEWVAMEPLSIERRRALIEDWDREWEEGTSALFGILRHGQIAGGCGLHRRIGPDGLEIGYWVHPQFLRQGVATAATGLLTTAAFGMPGITRVEIHHDKANRASGGVPAKLGFELVEEVPAEPKAPGDTGTECRWRMDRDRWPEAARR